MLMKKLQRRFALSERGARAFVGACLAQTLQNISFMAPAGLLFAFVRDLAAGIAAERALFYALACAGCLLFIAAATRLQYDGTYLSTYVESGVRRTALAEKLRRLPLSFFGRKDLADLSSSIMNDCAVLEKSQSHYLPALAGAMLSAAVVSAGLCAFDWRMALAVLWVLPPAFAVVAFSVRGQQALDRKSMAAKMACADGIQECLECLRDLKSNNAEDAYLDGLDEKIRAVERRAVVSESLSACFVTLATLLLRLGVASTALTGALLMQRGTLDAMTFFMFLMAVSRVYAPLEGALQNLVAAIATRTNIERMNEILDGPVQSGREEMNPRGCDVVFEHVDFAYESGVSVLKDVSFTARQGEVTALVGPSGGGKTTASRLAARFWDVSGGRITVGGENVAEIAPERLLSLFSIVFQDVTLFNNTVMENIRVGRRGAGDEEVIAAARLAHCDEFVDKLPEGWRTMIGENGRELSGGERQRISIARAILKDAPIVLLDEATAALDVENESQIQAALSRLIRDKTVLVIAHRLRTVASADKIVVLSGGAVAEQGAPDELLRRGGPFARMARLQTESRNWGL